MSHTHEWFFWSWDQLNPRDAIVMCEDCPELASMHAVDGIPQFPVDSKRPSRGAAFKAGYVLATNILDGNKSASEPNFALSPHEGIPLADQVFDAAARLRERRDRPILDDENDSGSEEKEDEESPE